MPHPGPLPTPRDNQRLTLRFLHAPLDVEHDGDVATLYDSAKRHPGVGARFMYLIAGLNLFWVAVGAFGLWALWPMALVDAAVLVAVCAVLSLAAFASFNIARLSKERLLFVDLSSGGVEIRWPDADLVRWTGDVDGLSLYVCPLRPLGSILLSPCWASVAALDGTRTPPNQLEFDHGPLTRALLRIFAATTAHKVNRHHTNHGWIVLATGDDPDALEAELREALPTLTGAIEPQRIDDPLTGPVDARLLRKATPRNYGAS